MTYQDWMAKNSDVTGRELEVGDVFSADKPLYIAKVENGYAYFQKVTTSWGECVSQQAHWATSGTVLHLIFEGWL